MADAATVQTLIDYYVNLLIIQYNQKPKARATIALYAANLLASAIYLDVLNGYNIDTAVGVQLDVIGKYLGVTRYYSEIDLINFFGLTTYALGANPPAGQFGACTYATFNGFSYNGTLRYDEIITTQDGLSDDDFRTLIRLAIITNNCSNGHGEVDQKLYALFGSTIRLETLGVKRIFYFFTTAITPLITAILQKKLLPKPMGVMQINVQQSGGPMFGFVTYDGIVQPNEMGCSTYANYATTPGAVLTYAQIIEG